jgi:hypothetical protein
MVTVGRQECLPSSSWLPSFVSAVSVALRVEHRHTEVPRQITRGVEIHSNENRAETSSGAASGLAQLRLRWTNYIKPNKYA